MIEEAYEPQAANYYRNQLDYATGLKYRLDGEDVIERAIDTLRGGVANTINGRKVYFEEFKLMNEVGIQRARMVLEAGVNKINHLTKYTDKEMIFRQIRSLTKAWLFEVTLNCKRWAPEATFTRNHLVNQDFAKIRNKRLVIQTVENALLQSMLRGTEGFEASLTSKQFSVQEIQDNRSGGGGRGGRGFFGGLFSRNKPEGGGDYYG